MLACARIPSLAGVVAMSLLGVAPPHDPSASAAMAKAKGTASSPSWLGSTLFGCSPLSLRPVHLAPFSVGGRSWSFAAGPQASGQIEPGGGESGVPAASVEAGQVSFPGWSSTVAAPSAGSIVHVTGDISTEGVAGGYGAYVALVFRDRSGTRVGLQESIPADGTVGWASLGESEVWATVPAGAAAVTVSLILNGTGSARFDDIALSAGTPPGPMYRPAVSLAPTGSVLDHVTNGLGVETNPFEFAPLNGLTSGGLEAVTERLGALRPAWARIFVSTAWWVTPGGFDFTTPMAQAVLEDARLFASLGTRLNLVVWQTPSWNPPYLGLTADIVALLQWLADSGATNVGLLTLGNEPDVALVPGTGSYEQEFSGPADYESAMATVRAGLDAAGFPAVGLAGGDVAVAGDGFDRIVAALPAALFSQLSYHQYVGYSASLCIPTLRAHEMAALAAARGRPAVMWESNLQGGSGADPTFSPGQVGNELLSATYGDALKLAAYYLQSLAAGIAGISYWEAMDMVYPSQSTMLYGMWGLAGQLRPSFYAYGLLARYLVPGSTLRAVAGGAGSLVAYEIAGSHGTRATYVINPWPRSVRLTFPKHMVSTECLFDAATVQLAQLRGALALPCVPAGATVSLPPQSMADFT